MGYWIITLSKFGLFWVGWILFSVGGGEFGSVRQYFG